MPVGLEQVSGVEGKVTFTGTWPDSIQAAALIVLDELDLENPANHLLSYSDPVSPGATEAEYFIQLKPGIYYIAALGITIEPSLFVTKIDSFLAAPESPIIMIDKDLQTLSSPVIITEKEILTINREVIF